MVSDPAPAVPLGELDPLPGSKAQSYLCLAGWPRLPGDSSAWEENMYGVMVIGLWISQGSLQEHNP